MDIFNPANNRHCYRQVILLFAFTLHLLLVSCHEDPEVPMTPEKVLSPISVQVNQPEDIQLLNNRLVPPFLYSNIQGLDSLPLNEKKMRFVSALLPAILVAKHEIDKQRMRFESLVSETTWVAEDSAFFQELTMTYRTNDTTAILSALQTHPNSIVLAQAAVESGWGNSRIFGVANNLFGIWSYRRDEPRIAASVKRGDQTIYLRKYNDISESISDYFITIGRSRPYERFRKARLSTDSVELLLPHLLYYSERRDDYVRQLGTMIRFNQLKRFDHYQLDSSYFIVPISTAE